MDVQQRPRLILQQLGVCVLQFPVQKETPQRPQQNFQLEAREKKSSLSDIQDQSRDESKVQLRGEQRNPAVYHDRTDRLPEGMKRPGRSKKPATESRGEEP